jgi:hypothetical protein
MQRKGLVEAFLVQDDAQNGKAAQYTISATISEIEDEQFERSAVAAPLGEVEWLIS